VNKTKLSAGWSALLAIQVPNTMDKTPNSNTKQIAAKLKRGHAPQETISNKKSIFRAN
jgi:hypothetical protein